ncbi:MAG: peptidyl-prolyl cis-trans isomerase, partial [Synergistaceae bacterium]|jgi:parvulin-like peptidyl-prolyl isomerase|nr:peptidyl-prolyl cis-trans isomerase [Synergistaceae bacterium]
MDSERDDKHSDELPPIGQSNGKEESSAFQDMLNAAGISLPHKIARPASDEAESDFTDSSHPEPAGDDALAQNNDGLEQDSGADGVQSIDNTNTEGKRSKTFPLVMIGIAVLIIVGAIASSEYFFILFEPTPPEPDIIATYNDKSINTEQLVKFISRENIREGEHTFCEKHGFDHSKCDELEKCEAHPIHSMKSYQQIVKMIAVRDLIMDWADKNGVTQREDVSHSLKDLIEGANVGSMIGELHTKELTPESIQKWEVQKYFDENKEAYEGRTFNEAENEIRNILVRQKDAEFFPAYIEELKRSAGLEVNFEILRVTRPTEGQMQSYYQDNPDKFTQTAALKGAEMRIAPSSSDADLSAAAQEAVKKLQAGAGFDEVAAQYAQGGVAAPVTLEKGTRGPVYEEYAWNLEPGEISEAFEDNGGMVIFQLLSKDRQGQKPFAEVREDIRQELLRENMDAEYALRKDDALFIIHGRRYTLGEFYTEFKELPPEFQDEFSSFEEKKSLVEQMIAKELLLEEYGDDSESDEDQHRIEHIKQEYLKQVLHQEKVDTQLSDVTDEEAGRFYEENKQMMVEAPTVKISLIWINGGGGGGDYEKNRGMADEALAAIRGGADFGDIAKQYSQDASAGNGGAYPVWFHAGDLPPEISSAVFAAKKGEVTDIIETRSRFYIIKIDDRTEERLQSYEEVADVIKNYMKGIKHLELEANVETDLLAQSQFTVYNRTLRSLLKENEGAESK